MSEITLQIDTVIRVPLPLPHTIIAQFKSDLTHKNPKYYMYLRVCGGDPQKVPPNVPAKILSYWETQDAFIIPRGTGIYARSLLTRHGYVVMVNDCRVVHTDLINFHPRPGWDLRPHQKEARASFSVHEQGTLEAPCGSGKTTSSIYEIACRRQPTMVVVHTKDLMKQWISEIHEKFIFEDGEIGTIGEGNYLPNKITIGMVQSLINLSRTQWKELQAMFGMVIVDECYLKGSRIQMADGSERVIEDVKNGDKVAEGGEVSNRFSREESGYYRIRTTLGYLNCTKNNPCFVVQRKKNVHENKYEPFGFDNIKRVQACFVHKGDVFLSPTKYKYQRYSLQVNVTPAKLAAILADGHINKHRIKLSVTKLRKIKLFKTIFKGWAYSVNKRGDHTFWINKTNAEYGSIIQVLPGLKGKKSNKIYIPDHIFWIEKEYKHEFLNTLVNCDGTVYDNIWKYYTTSKRFCYDLLRFCKFLGMKMTFCTKKNLFSITYCISIAIKEEKGIYSADKKYHLVKVLEDPEWVNKTVSVYDFETETHRLVVNHMLHSNCHHVPADTFLRIVNRFPAKYRYGVSATPTRKDQMEFLLFEYIGPIVHRVLDSSLERAGYTTSAMVKKVLTQYYYPYGNMRDWTSMVSDMAKNDQRNSIILSNIINDVQQGNFSLVLSDRKKHCRDLGEKLMEVDIKVRVLTSEVLQEHRDRYLQECREGSVDVLIATQLADEALDVPNLNSVHLTCPSNNEQKLKQRVGRVRRSLANKQIPTVFDYVDHTIDKCGSMWQNRKKWYLKWGFNLLNKGKVL